MDRVKQIQGQSYGQRRPSLTAVLRRILEGYPDGAQILKELIQNADDAGATEVKVLFDSRENAFGTSSLIHPELSKFQGSALYVYNNGLFKENDWHGIEGVMQGNKRLDPFTAGRFGVGFNSVYHITDLPSVVSDHYVAFLDPQETYFGAGETGRRFDLRNAPLAQFGDQFAPFEDVLGCKISSAVFDGTLFRLPLRKWPSRVSVKPYTALKVKALFQAFMEEAHLLLIFLKNVQTITLYETTKSEKERETYSITIKEGLKASIREMRKHFISFAMEAISDPREMTYEMILKQSKNGKLEKEYKYMVLNRIGGQNPKLSELSMQLHLLPWAGVAASLGDDRQNTGRVFSFLPLPPESDCRSGLSVHIHGTFGVTDNRRNLKWPGNECQNDDTADWNHLLLTEVISKAYAHLLIELTRSQYPISEVLPVVSSILPDLDSIQGHWQLLLEPLFSELANKPVFWTEAEGGKWIALEDAVLSRLSRSSAKTRPETSAAVVKCLLLANQPVICLPAHALQAVDDYLLNHVHTVPEVTPSYVREVLRRDSHQSENTISNNTATGRKINWKFIDRNERLNILEFVLKDGDLMELAGLPLLPLANNTFAEFRPNSFKANPNNAIFVASRLHPQTLIPRSGSKFLDTNLNDTIMNALKAGIIDPEKDVTSLEAPTQLVFMAPFLVPDLLRDVLPDEWRGNSAVVPWDPKDSQAGETWLKGLWSWLRTEFPTDLKAFEGVPLVPLASGRTDAKRLIKIKSNHTVIQSSSHFASLPRNVTGALQNAGCVVLLHIPMFCDHLDLRKHLEPPTPSGVLKVLSSVIEGGSVLSISQLSTDEKRAIRSFLSSLRNPSDDEIVTLMSLPIFETIEGSFTSLQSGETTSVLKRDVAPPRLSLPGDILIPESDQIISASDEDSYQLLRRLPVRILNMSNFLIERVFPFVEGQAFYTRNQVTALMTWVLQRLPVLSSENRSFPDHLKILRFVPVGNDRLKAPCDLFDPDDDILKNLFDGEPTAFPEEEFATSHSLSVLRVFLGLRRSRTLVGQDVLTIAKQIAGMPEDKAKKRALALMKFLNEQYHLLETRVSVDNGVGSTSYVLLSDALSDFPWLPASRLPPNKYPTLIPWFNGNQHLYRPCEVSSVDDASLIGSIKPTIEFNTNKSIRKAFGWEIPPLHTSVLEQLQIISKCWNDSTIKQSETEILKLRTIVHEIYTYLSHTRVVIKASATLKKREFGPWVWCGTCFTFPCCVAFQSCCPFDLRPYLYVLNEDFKRYTDLLKKSGVKDAFRDEDILEILSLMRKRHSNKRDPVEVKHDLYLVTEILHYVIRNGHALSDELQKKVYVPIQTTNDMLCLEPVNQVNFCDGDWLKNQPDDIDITFTKVIHESISAHTANLLGVKPMSRSLEFVETLGFEQTGPHEPVTTRLQNILKEYRDGFGLFKELIQNADDAGASEVRFLIDWRENPTEQLLSSGMSDAQGPALWAYNDAIFTDKDFENINRLAGATKMDSVNKIGRFGLGFCTTYNLTDIPSFISREFLVIFDPQTTHLGHLIKDKARPGIRLNLKRNAKALSTFQDQFLPYHNIFGCEIKNLKEDFYFDGTLFRFPLRTKEQAETSEISDLHYDKDAFRSLVNVFRENASNLLLFVDNVRAIKFYEIQAHVGDQTMKELFCLKKENIERVPRISHYRSQSEPKSSGYQSPKLKKLKQLKDAHIVSLESKCFPCTWFSNEFTQSTTQVWLISYSGGRSLSIDLSATEEGKMKGLVSQASIAAMLSSSAIHKAWNPQPVKGEAFFSLPLSFETGLPVHVNGCFAVTSNRRGLWEDTGADYGSLKPFEVLWNQTLLEDAASVAYIHLLEDLVVLNKEGKVEDFQFEVLWPDSTQASTKMWRRFVNSVYLRISESSLPLLKSSSKWVSIKDGVHVDEKVRRLPECESILKECNYQVIDYPQFVYDAFIKAGLGQNLDEQTITLDIFLKDIFFDNLEKLSINSKEAIIASVLDEYLSGSTHYAKYLLDNPCIPSSPDGRVLVSPKSLVDPCGAAAVLYSENEHRFPCGNTILTEERLVVLRKLGMVEDILSWQSICERASTVVKMKNNREQALQRVQALIKYLNNHLSKLDSPSDAEVEFLRSIGFLPVMDQPPDYCIPWKGSYKPSKRGIALLAPVNLYGSELKYLLGTSKPILDESVETGCGKIDSETLQLLGIANKEIDTKDVLFQLSSAVQKTRIQKTEINWLCIREICFAVYHFLQKQVKTSERKAIVEILQEKPWILINFKFVNTNQVALEWDRHGDPFLFRLPEELTLNFYDLFEACGVRWNFGADDFIEALFSFQERKQGQPLTQSEFKTTKALLNELSEMHPDALESFYKHLPVPDSEQVLRPVGQLVINDAPWLNQEKTSQCVHPDISSRLAHSLGAHKLRDVTLNKYSRCMGKPFGQVEHLTMRLKNILKSYPCDSGILKEILQNADDAQATEIHFIYDPRQHGTKHVLNESWKQLQGPALCVYNDRPFSDQDIEGIQRLGLGNKAEHSDKIGQYGIGFNAVYHLTECPSFITDANTLCILDPHAKYAPDATADSPGRLLEPLDFEFRNDFSDVMDGYLSDCFLLEGATMFRFPLRTKAMADTSEISTRTFDDLDISRLLKSFEKEAKEALVFLSSVRKITISQVIDNRLVTKFQVLASITDEGKNRLQEVRTQVRLCKEMSTKDIPWYGSTYTIKISDSNKMFEEWLVHQCLSAEQFIDEDDIPDGKKLGLLPVAGIAACIKTANAHTSSNGNCLQSSRQRPHFVFCSLPLQSETALPVHINGQFALDNSRRNLWIDQDEDDSRSQWNEFVKTQVLAPAYAKLLIDIRVHIQGIHEGNPWFFTNKRDAHFGLKWFQSLFPDHSVVHTDWKAFVISVYTSLALTHSPVLPVLKGQDEMASVSDPPSKELKSNYYIGTVPIPCVWLPPHSTDEDEVVYFSDLDESLERLLLNVSFPVVFSSSHIHKQFKDGGASVRKVTPEDVVKFLRGPRCNIGPIPCSIKDSKLKDALNLKSLMKYCIQSDGVITRLHGLPLLLTEDETLRRFDIEHPVFFTSFLDLVPKQKELFLHREFVSLFSEHFPDPIKKSGIFKRFDTSSLEAYMVHLLPSHWNAIDKPVSWDPTSDVKPSREWLTLLWKLISEVVKERQSRVVKKDESVKIFRHLEDWPIIPISSEALVSIAYGKTVLIVNPQEDTNYVLINILRKLGCGELDFSPLPDLDATELSQMLGPYLARPNSKLDLLAVLENLMKEKNISDILDDMENLAILTFFQEEVTTVYSHKTTIRSLPFFKTLNGKNVSLSSYVSAYVLELPKCVPLKDIESRVEMEGCVLLEEVPELEPLYTAIDVYRVSKTEVFVKYILPNLDVMTDEGRYSVLKYIKDDLLVSTISPNERSVIIDTLIGINILPDQTGELTPASKYYDPANPVFKTMLPEESFPQGEFANEGWLCLLRDIGLKQTVSQQDFIEFAESTASNAEMNPSDINIRERSKALVTYLLEEESLHDASFLHVVAQIKFVVAETASENLRNMYEQFESKGLDNIFLFTAFQGSVSHECQKFLWTSASLLPKWALPKSGENQRLLVENLGIEVVPPYDKVIKHLENLSKKYAGNVNKDTPKYQRELLLDVIYSILGFFKTETGCPQGSSPSDGCSKSCQSIGKILRNVSCIPVEEGRIFVQGEQLAFEMSVELPPFLYKVPREYGHFEHVLKRLGAEEKNTPLQFAAVLKRLKEVCSDKPMEPNEKRVARMASQGFFSSMSILLKEEKESSVTTLLSRIEELFLPNKDGFLKPSHELILYDDPSFERRACEYAHSFVDIALEEELTADRLAHLFNVLPPRLRARTIQSIIHEEFHPFSRDKLCLADRQDNQCSFIARYRSILLSPKLINGIIRVIKHQRQTANIPQEVRDQVHVLSALNISCMGTVETHLVNLETNFPIKNSQESQDCFLEERDKRWELFIKHGTDENPLNIQLCFLINRLIGNYIEKEIYLQAMIACRVPDDILPALDRCGVAQDLLSTELSTKDPSLGSEIPAMYHYLLMQDLDYFFRQGEIIGYEKERIQEQDQLDEGEPLYVYAKVINKLTVSSNNEEHTKIDLQARYRVDVGEPKLVEVSVLDLYKFDRSSAEFRTLSDVTDILPFTGDPDSEEYKASTRNTRLENAMKEVKEILWEAWKLDDKGRKKVIKRLFLRWHPDKNPGCDIANEVMKFLLGEIERLERLFPTTWKKNTEEEKEAPPTKSQTFSDLFEKWNQRAHQEWQTFNTFKRQRKSYSGAGSPQRKEAKRWIKQANDDLIAAKCLSMQESESFCNCICFLCQQSAEKAFKAALYAVCGIAENQLETHDVLNLAYEITELSGSPPDITQLASKLKNYYEKTRYPHFHHGESTPSDMFSKDNADEALLVAELIIQKIQEFINEKTGEE